MMDSTGDNRLDELAEEFVARFRGGERPALTEYTTRHPELAEQIRELFPLLVTMEQVRPGTPVERTDHPTTGVNVAKCGSTLRRTTDSF